MTEPYRQNVNWQMDWNGNGLFDHPQSDVSAFVTQYTVRWGSAADTPVASQVTPDSPDVTIVGGILGDSAIGQLVLYDADGRFDPDNPNLLVDEVALRSPVTVRLMYDNVEIWRGRAKPQYGAAIRPTTNFNWELIGLHGEAIKGRVEVLDTGLSSIRDVTDEEVPVDFSTGVNPPLGIVQFAGTRIKYYEALARLAGGWVIEDAAGDWRLQTLADAHAKEAATTITVDFERYDGAVFRELSSLVRTRCTLGSLVYEPELDDNGNRREVSIGRKFYNLGSSAQIIFDSFVAPLDDTRRVDQWLPPSPSAGGTISSFTRSGRTINYVLAIAANAGEVIVNFPANISRLSPSVAREVVFDTAEQTYGKRDLGIEPWLPTSLEGGERTVVPWLEALSEPLGYVNVRYPEWQANQPRLQQLSSVVPGTVVNLELPTQQKVEKVVKTLVLAVRLTGGYRQIPTRTIYGIETRDRPPQPLVAMNVQAVSPFQVQALIRLSDVDASKTMYVNIEEAT